MNEKALVLAANAVARQGGQGLNLQHMLEALREDFSLSVFCRGSGEPRTHQVPASPLSTWMGRVPLLRRRRDWMVLASDLHFDHYVASHLPAADVFQGVVGQCAESLHAARRRGMRTVLDVVNTHVEDFRAHVDRESHKFGLKGNIGPRMYRRILDEYRTADVVRVMSERARRTFLARGFPEEKLVVATPPLELSEFPQATFPQDVFRVSFVGLIEPWKGFHYLLEAWDSLKPKDAELVLWGGPGSRAATNMLREFQARDTSLVVKPVEVRKVGYGEVYGKTSVLVHPSLADGFSYSVAEAMASGVPVIVTDNTGAADLVEDGVNGYIVPTGDARAIRERLEHLHRHPELLPGMGAKAREAVQRHLTPENFRRPLVTRILQALA
ncbi:glycosyltransferase [Archangium violaceum]|uniref:glycosyltransferase family 4 protein n=1 Tax=Archangium violaceum TaxID=83451 RepID=UPI0019526807|nr:glycosyltransferase [Archangium violaceum]QRN95946.1 glycosyltransferase [Archangium violaceum]